MQEPRSIPGAREQILRAALKCFAECGYAAASVQRIVDEAQVSKPTLYYYFRDKAKLFEALVQQAQEERYQAIREAAASPGTTEARLERLIAKVFDLALKNKELVRLAIVTAFAGSGEVPTRSQCHQLGRRNFESVRSIIQQGQASGELDAAFSADELTMGIYGQMNVYVMVHLLDPESPLDKNAASGIVRLFMRGAEPNATKKRTNGQTEQPVAGGMLQADRQQN